MEEYLSPKEKEAFQNVQKAVKDLENQILKCVREPKVQALGLIRNINLRVKMLEKLANRPKYER